MSDYLSKIKDLPVMPEVASKILGLGSAAGEISFSQLEEIIKVDIGLTAKILKIANSALYARQREISDLRTAITMLGFKNIKTLVLLVTASGLFHHIRKTSFYQDFWRHSIVTAVIGQDMATRHPGGTSQDEMFLAGILHEIGQPVLLIAERESYPEVLEAAGNDAVALEELEQQRFSIDHRSLGAELLRNWNFPSLYVDIAAQSGTLAIDSPHKSTILVVTISSILAAKLGYGRLRADADSLLQELMPRANVGGETIRYYTDTFGQTVMEQDLVRTTLEMFDVKAGG